MTSDQKLSKTAIKQLIIDQLLAANPASLSEDILIRGLGYVVRIPNAGYIFGILDEMLGERTIVKIVEDQVGPRFALASRPTNACEERCDD
ncbi:MAG: hypothetical protein LBS87_00140 [Puniceicoccales bacterium]|jgi:hypothetical protein|nr:hypothetical protein [Puniceicoccales bacterium]